MKAYLVKTLIGIFAVDERRKVILFRPYSKNPEEIASKFLSEDSDEFRQVKQEVSRKGIKDIIENDKSIAEFVNQNLLKYAMENNFAKSNIEFNQLLTQINLEISKQKVKKATGRDNLIIHTVNAIDEIDRAINIFVERLREMYGLHFPEMDRAVADHEKFAKFVEKFGSKELIEDGDLKQLARHSMGMEFTKQDVEMSRTLAGNIVKLYEIRKFASNYLSNILKEIIPNFSALAGDIVAARLVAKAGGLERLARMPSSTIQLLGSEKALFRFLKSRKKSKSPKYGIIYNHPLIQNAPDEKRGKIARLLASKLSIAARIDYYSKEYKADQMKKELEKKVKEI
ncbi:MAG: hypothetical protein HYT70_01015 [Candidatus Aenigmarchaeota archaeon]|nr:hypothetical protein [Candidatus Aenigmarchaeota archaeon]